jgi:ATP-binding cassette subfamily F protein uup
MQNPNFLLLDEPTNDLDIITLNVLEDYLNAFEGCAVVVSHDRFFMDKIVDHLFVFEGEGKITDFPGNYTIYRNSQDELNEKREKEQKTTEKSKKASNTKNASPKTAAKLKLTFKEKRELEQLETEIAELEEQKNTLEEMLHSGNLAHEELYQKSEQLVQLKNKLDEKEIRWLQLSEME